MDWATITSAALGSGIAVTAVGYLLKTTIERAIDIRIERIREQNKAEIQEHFRRESLVWTRQYEAGRSLLSLIYRSRNTYRDLLSLIATAGRMRDRGRKVDALLSQLRVYGEGIVEILYDERAILPRPLFSAAHELKNVQATLFKLSEDQDAVEFPRQANELYKRIDSIYNQVVEIVHEVTGIKNEKDPRT